MLKFTLKSFIASACRVSFSNDVNGEDNDSFTWSKTGWRQITDAVISTSVLKTLLQFKDKKTHSHLHQLPLTFE